MRILYIHTLLRRLVRKLDPPPVTAVAVPVAVADGFAADGGGCRGCFDASSWETTEETVAVAVAVVDIVDTVFLVGCVSSELSKQDTSVSRLGAVGGRMNRISFTPVGF